MAASCPNHCMSCLYSLLCSSELKGKGNSYHASSCWNLTSLFVWLRRWAVQNEEMYSHGDFCDW